MFGASGTDFSLMPCLVARNNTILAAEKGFTELTGYTCDEVKGRDVEEVFGRLLKCTSSISGISQPVECFVFNRSLEPRDVVISSAPASFTGEVFYYINEKPCSRLECKVGAFNSLLADSYLAIGIFSSPDFYLLKANKAFIDLLPEPPSSSEYCYGSALGTLLRPEISAAVIEKLSAIAKSGRVFYGKEINMPKADKIERYYDNTIIPVIDDGKVRYIISMMEDVTEKVLVRKNYEEQARLIERQKEQLETVIDNISDALAIIDKEGKYIRINRSFKDFLEDAGLNISNDKLEEALVKELLFFDQFGSELQLDQLPGRRVLKGEKIEQQKIIVKSADRKYYFIMRAIPIFDKKGNFNIGIITSSDMSAQVEYLNLVEKQQQLILQAEMEKNRELEKLINVKDEFFSMITHEFKTPLTVINAAIQAMEFMCGDQLPDKAKLFIKRIQQNSNRQLRLVNNLLDITKVNAGHIKLKKKNYDIVFLSKAIVESVQLFARQKGIELMFSSEMAKKVIGLDDEKYERILLNLLSNAIKFTPRGKSIKVDVYCKQLRHQSMACVEVKDEGVGIPSDKQEYIFERFGQVESLFTRQAEGTGLGLSLVRLLVDASGGKIQLESSPGKGSTFTVLLPDETTAEGPNEREIEGFLDNRLIRSVEIEFSDIYF